MNYFFDAFKRAAGEPIEAEAEAAAERLRPAARSAPLVVQETAIAAAPATTPAPAPAKIREAKIRKNIERLVATVRPNAHASSIVGMEQCRVLRNRIREILRSRKAHSLMITSATEGEGKTLMSCNLAFSFSQLESTRVLLIDADLRRPALSSFLGLEQGTGLIEYLRGTAEVDEAKRRVDGKLDIITASDATENASELLHSPRMKKLLEQAKENYDVVLIDAPPVMPVVDAEVLATISDACLLVVRADHAPAALIRRSAEMPFLKSKLIGSVLNSLTSMPHSQYGNYYSGYAGGGRK